MIEFDNIPVIKRDYKLLVRLLPVVLAGFDDVLDKQSQLYLRLLIRLTDKAFNEYVLARDILIEEIKLNDRLAYRYEVINHLENCVSAISRAGKIMEKMANGITVTDKNKQTRIIKNNIDIYNLLSKKTKEKIFNEDIKKVRNRVEHIDEDIYLNKFKNQLFLDVNNDYKKIGINNKQITFLDLANTIKIYNNIAIEIFNGLPNQITDGKYYKDGVPFTTANLMPAKRAFGR